MHELADAVALFEVPVDVSFCLLEVVLESLLISYALNHLGSECCRYSDATPNLGHAKIYCLLLLFESLFESVETSHEEFSKDVWKL